jgi:hypothetical protein
MDDTAETPADKNALKTKYWNFVSAVRKSAVAFRDAVTEQELQTVITFLTGLLDTNEFTRKQKAVVSEDLNKLKT